MKIKRENWRGKYILVAREKGKIIAKIPYSSKVPIEKHIEHFKKFNSLDLNKKKIALSNFYEVEVLNIKNYKISSRYQISLTANIKGVLISARSDRHYKGYPIEKAREEAENRLYGRISNEIFKRGYDEDIGQQIVEEENISVKESIIQYQKKSSGWKWK